MMQKMQTVGIQNDTVSSLTRTVPIYSITVYLPPYSLHNQPFINKTFKIYGKACKPFVSSFTKLNVFSTFAIFHIFVSILEPTNRVFPNFTYIVLLGRPNTCHVHVLKYGDSTTYGNCKVYTWLCRIIAGWSLNSNY